MHNHDTGTSSDALLAGAIFGNEGFMNNTVWYTSPKFGGFTVDLAHSLLGVERLPGESQPSYFGIVGSYDTGPLHVAVSHAETKNSTDLDPGAGVTSNKDRATTIGGLYNLKFVVLGALYEKAKSATFGTGDVSRDYFRVSAMVRWDSTSFTPTTSPRRPRSTGSTPPSTTIPTAPTVPATFPP